MNKFFKRLALLLAVLMIVSMMPVQLFADNSVTGEGQSNGTGEASGNSNAVATVNGVGYATLAEAIAKATPDTNGVITYEISGKATVDSTGWIQVARAGLAGLTKVEFVGKTSDAEICITGGLAILADQKYDIDVSFEALTLSKLNPTYGGDYGHSTNYFTTWLSNTNAAENTVTYTNCTFPNGLCNNQYGKTVVDGCKFTNATSGKYNFWNYGGNTEIKNSTFTGVRGIKTYNEGTLAVAPTVKIENTTFDGLTEKAAIVTSKATDITLDNVSATKCTKGFFQKAIEGSSDAQEIVVVPVGSNISGKFNVNGTIGVASAEEFNISGGTFTSEVSSDYLADGFELKKNTDGTYGVKAVSVAKIGTVEYATLAEAIAAAKDGDTVTLTADINTPETSYYIQKSLTIDLGGKTLTGSGYDGVFNIEGENAAVLIKNGKIVAVEQTGTAGKYTMAVWACAAGCAVTLEDLDVSQQITHTDDKQMDMIYTSKGTIIINSGRFESGTPAWTLNCNDSAYKAGTAKIIVNGGTFVGYDPRNNKAEGEGTSFVAPGVGVDAADGSFTAKAGMTAQVMDAKGASVKAFATLAEAIAAAERNNTVKLLADTKENVTISTRGVTLDLNGFTLNGSTGERKPALTITERYVTIKDSSEAQTGTIMREDTAENSGVSSHYVIDIQGNAFVTFESGNVKNDSGAGGTKGASLVRIGTDDQPTWKPQLTIKGGTFTQDNFIVLKVGGYGTLYVNGGTINSKNSYAVENWSFAVIKDQAVVNGKVSSWTYKNSLKKNELEIRGGTVNGDVESVSYDGAEGKLAKVAITGGTVNGTLSTKRYSSATEPSKEMATIEITGGTFTKDPSKYVVEGSAITDNGDGTFGVAKAYLAEVDGNKYYTMDEAFHAAVAAGSTLKLLRNYTTASSQNSGSKSFTIDLNGFTWTYTSTDFDCAAFEINYPNVTLTVKNGTVVSASMAGLIPSAMSGTITYDNSGLVFDGVEITANGHSGIETNGNNTNDTVTLKNSTLNVPNGFGIYFPSSGTLTLDNSTVNAKTMGVQVCAGSLSINEGSAVTVTGDAVPKAEKDGAIQDGAAISIVNRTGYKGLDTVTISGGKFTAKEGNSAIKAYNWVNNTESDFTASEKVAVSGGTFSSAVPADLCAEGLVPVANTDGTYGVKAGKYVAQIGDVKYETLADALAAAKDGDTVKLLDNVDLTETLIIKDKTITLDLNGKTISNSTDIWNESIYAWSLISVRDNGDLTIDDTVGGGTLKAKENDCFTLDVYAYDTKNVENTKLTINAGNYVGNISAVYAFTGKVTINGGHFSIQQKESGSDPYRLTLNCYDSSYTAGGAGFTVNGGTFENFDPRNNPAEGTGTSFVAEGVGINKDENGNFTAKSGMAAQIVDENGGSVAAYATLAEALTAANAGETVKLLADVTADVVIDKNITLDLGGKTLTNTGAGKATISIANGATATVKNGTVIGGATYYNIEVTKGSNANLTLEDVTATAGNTGSSMIDNWGTMTIKSGTYTGGMNTVKSEEGSTLVINDGTFTCDYGKKWSYTATILVYGKTTINGGTFIQKTTNTSSYAKVVMTGIVEGYEAITKVTGGTFTNEKLSGIFWALGNATSDNFEVSGGTFNKYVNDSYFKDGYIPVKNADGTYGVKEGKFVVEVGSTGYETFDEAIAAANASASSTTIYLRENLTVDHQIIINNTKGKKITLNLKSFTLTSTYADTSYSLLTRTAVTIKNGTYKSTNESARGIGAYADFVLDGVTVDVAGLVGVACSESGKTYVIKNSVVKAGYAVCNFANNATITISDSTLTGTGNVLYHNGSNYGLKLTVTNSTITGTSDDCCGVYISGSTSAQANSDNQNGAGGYQQATFTKCTISGTNGIEVKYTDLTLDGCTVISTSDAAPSYTQNNNGPAASGFAVVSTDNATQGNTPKPEGTIIVKGEGKYTGPVGLGSLESVKTSYAGFNDETIKVSGGTFSSAVPEEYCAEGFIPTKNADGTYGVKEGMYVAQIGDVKYETLKDAFAAAKDGDTITIVRNFTTNETKTTAADRATVTANVTLDFGSYVMTVPASLEPTDNFMAILVDGSTLTVEGTTGGIVSGDAETCGVYGFNVKGGGKLVINGGGYYCGITVAQAQLGTIEVNGGSFAVNDGSGKYPGYMFNCVDANYVAGTAGITVNGGTFVGYDPRNNTAEGTGTSFVAEGVGIDKNADGTFTAKSGMAAQIVDADGNSVAAYATLADAIAAANAGETVKLLADVTLDAAVKVPAGKNVTLDLNGKKLSTTTKTGDATRHYYAIDNYGTFTLRDSSAEQSGEIRARGIENLGTGTMTIESGKIVAIDANGGAAIWNNANLTINGGTFVAEHVGASSDQYGPGCVYNNGTLTINGGTFTSANKRTYAIVSKAGTVTITPADGKNVTIFGAHGGLGIDGGTAIINGGSYASSDYYGLYVSNDAGTADVTVNGGTFTGKKYSVLIGSDGSSSVTSTLKIKGGTFDMPIHAQENTIDGTIAISGGKFKFKVDDKYFADKLACSATPNADGYYTVMAHPIISAGISIGEDMSFRIMVGEGYENGSLKYYYIGVNGRVEGEGTIGTDTQGNSIFRIYNVNPQRADLIYVIQYYDADGNAIGAPKEISVLTYFEGFYNMEAGKNEDVEARKTFIANFLEYCASAMERSYADFPKETLDGKTWQYRADAVRAMMTRLGLKVADYEFKGNLGRYYNDNAKGNITDRGIVFGSTFRAYYEISKDIIDSGCRVFRQGTDVTDKLVLENGAYRFYFELAPYEFKDSLTITIYNGTTKVCEYSSPLANTLKAISESTNVSASKLAKAAFNYFVALQNYEG